VISRRNVIRNGQEGERPRASHGHPSLALLGRLLWRLVPTRFPRRNCAELFLYEGLDASRVKVPNGDCHGVSRHVMPPIEAVKVIARHRAQVVLESDDRPPI
jgi:hypothetical protein